MSDQNKLPVGIDPEAQIIQFVIELNPSSGAVNVRAPQDSILCYGLLEIARQVIQQRAEGKLSQSPILGI